MKPGSFKMSPIQRDVFQSHAKDFANAVRMEGDKSRVFVTKGARAGASLATFGLFQIPIVGELVTTFLVPVFPELAALGEEAAAAWGAWKVGKWAEKKAGEWYDRNHIRNNANIIAAQYQEVAQSPPPLPLPEPTPNLPQSGGTKTPPPLPHQPLI